MSVSDPDLVRREYATLDRLRLRRCDVTGWLRFGAVDDEVTQMLSALREIRPRRVLDAGCGDGWIAASVVAPEVVCIDLSLAAVESARARGLDARVADVAELPFADGEFDAVMCNNVLYHLPDRQRGIAELARVLRAGGRLVGIYGFDDHLQELVNATAFPVESGEFGCDQGQAELAPHFDRVERREAGGAVLWETRDDVQAYLDAYVELAGELEAPDGPYPFVARRHKCVLVADKAS